MTGLPDALAALSLDLRQMSWWPGDRYHRYGENLSIGILLMSTLCQLVIDGAREREMTCRQVNLYPKVRSKDPIIG